MTAGSPTTTAFADAVDAARGVLPPASCTDFDLELDLVGTEFQRRVWEALLTIPYGETRSYGEIAAQIGAPGASRAVGLANGHNPIGIIVPCHRVIGANGSLTGYGGGLDRKRALLGFGEAARAGRTRRSSTELLTHKCLCPPTELGGTGLNVCSAVSYFSTRVGSIIGAGRLSFRVRDGSGRFPAAMDRRNFIHSFLSVNFCVSWVLLVVGCGCLWFVVWLRGFVGVVSFRPVSASSLRPLLVL